jgi:hypothetical protein
LLYASKLSADAAAGSANNATVASSAQRASLVPLGIRPPRIGRKIEP